MVPAWRFLLLAGSALLGGAVPLVAQRRLPAHPEPPRPLQVLALHDLRFGNLFAGIPVTVPVTDFARVGLFEVRGPVGASVRVDFLLPSFLVAIGSGALLPVSFGPGDGFATATRDAPGGLVFNPHGPVVSSLFPPGFLYVRIGGTARPGMPQNGGEYRATISITVSDLGS